LARDAQAKLALIVAQCLSIHLSIRVSVRDSLSHAYIRSIARREPRRLPAISEFTAQYNIYMSLSFFAAKLSTLSHTYRHAVIKVYKLGRENKLILTLTCC